MNFCQVREVREASNKASAGDSPSAWSHPFCRWRGTPGRRLRRLGQLLLVALLALTPLLSACSGSAPAAETEPAKAGRLRVIASIFAPYDFCRQITQGSAEVSMLVPPGAETHSYEPTPADIAALSQADVFVYVGGESDAWLEDTLTSIENPELRLIRLVDMVPLLDEVQLEGMQEEVDEEALPDAAQEGEGAVLEDPEIDEHVWTSVANAERIVEQLAEQFAELDSANASAYQANAAAYLNELQQLDERFRTLVASSQRQVVVFADRFPFRYFAHEYGLECYAAFSGCSTAVDTDPQTIAFLIDKVEELALPAVFFIELSSHRIAATISETTGCAELLLHSCHNISQSDFDAGLDYLTLMYQNADNLEVALN